MTKGSCRRLDRSASLGVGMSNIVCPACNAYLGLAAKGTDACPKCGAILGKSTSASDSTTPKKNLLRGFLLSMGVLALMALMIGVVVLIAPRFVDAAIPGVIGLWMFLWPRAIF